ncbi:Z1 domain-containing protein [Armatimonas sp.]|uniref:Z1 domain-containing protein n=1 Tax=Armatimonas sp. TaxID=1872638 RepID=UPI00286B1327|nr:Z1 domain-containing protein [Armatimonas sp.]
MTSEIIEILRPQQTPGSLWEPRVGNELLTLLSNLHLNDSAKEVFARETISIVSRCNSPTGQSGNRTGLVIGYVQSGKTMSFTAVTALARDNGFRLVILLSGGTVNLNNQSNVRVKQDLGVNDRRVWRTYENPKNLPQIRQGIESAIHSDSSASGLIERPVLITVMKNSKHLSNLIELLSSLNLKNVPAIIIDDEADQAGLNNLVKKQKESPTYSKIVSIRKLIPNHSFLQYTATPQALFLINLIDVLSPSFAVVLTPGADYTGGRVFFEKDLDLLERIKPEEIGTKDFPLSAPPSSLIEAMRIFYIGVAAGLMEHPGSNDNRSMMVHPSKETMQHASYAKWVTSIRNNWLEILSLSDSEFDKHELLEEFKLSYNKLKLTVDDIPDFEKLINFLKPAIETTVIMEVNASRGKTQNPDFKQDYSHIIVGGEVLNRGFTIEGLTVTYMPRGKGVGNADTIQQRARWFGYKASYLGYCRVYLEDQVRTAYEGYVAHEENVRKQIGEHQATGRALRDWRRTFLLPVDMRPTRSGVIGREYIQGKFSDSWFNPKAPHDSEEAITDNRLYVQNFLESLTLVADEGHPNRTEYQRHLVAKSVSLLTTYEDFLTKLHMTRATDSIRFNGLLLQVKNYLEQSNIKAEAICNIYYISGGKLRRHQLNDEDEIPNMSQGAYPNNNGAIYPGDDHLEKSNELTILIRNLQVSKDGEIVADNVPAVSIWVPKKIAAEWLSQHNEVA